MMAKIKFTDTENLDPYSDEYNEKIQKHKDKLESLLKNAQEIRLSDIKSEYQSKIDDWQREINEAKKELEDTRKKLIMQIHGIQNAKTEIEENEKRLDEAKKIWKKSKWI